jgi:hypothetical protein
MTRLPEHAPQRRESAKQGAKQFKKIGNPTGFFIFFACCFAARVLAGA